MAKEVKEKPKVSEELEVKSIPNHENVKAVMVQYPHVHTIHVNAEGEWHFMEKPGFTAYTREDILK